MISGLGQRLDELRVALMFLTRLPVGTLTEPFPSLADARWALPLVGLLSGSIVWAVHHGTLAVGLPSEVAAFVAIGAGALLTGGLHFDGLADFADGIGGGRDKDHCLEIMRDSRIGTYGVLALIFAVGLLFTSLHAVNDGASIWLFAMIGVGSRLVTLVILDLLPPARADGLGHAAAAPGLKAWAPGLAVLAGIGLIGGSPFWLLIPVFAVAAALVAWLAHRRIGGQTGDVLGAVQLCSEVLAWIAAAALLAA